MPVLTDLEDIPTTPFDQATCGPKVHPRHKPAPRCQVLEVHPDGARPRRNDPSDPRDKGIQICASGDLPVVELAQAPSLRPDRSAASEDRAGRRPDTGLPEGTRPHHMFP
jgi:hypothetical protein